MSAKNTVVDKTLLEVDAPEVVAPGVCTSSSSSVMSSEFAKFLTDGQNKGFLAFFIIIALITLIICTVLAVQNKEWFNSLSVGGWAMGGWLIFWAVVLWIGVILLALGSFYAYAAGTEQMKIAIVIVFLLTMISLIIWFCIMYYNKDLTVSFYFSFVVVILTLILLVLNWRVAATAGYFSILQLIVSIVIVIFAYNTMNANTINSVPLTTTTTTTASS